MSPTDPDLFVGYPNALSSAFDEMFDGVEVRPSFAALHAAEWRPGGTTPT